MSMARRGMWSEVAGDLLDEIEEFVVSYGDKVRIRAVCTYWNSHLDKLPNHKQIQLPLLFQPLDENNNKDDDDAAAAASHGLFSLIENKFYYVDLPSVAQGKLFIGFSHGYISTIQYADPDPSNYAIHMHLINPFTNHVIQLPPRIKFPDVAEYCADRVGDEYKLFYQNFDNCPVDERTHSGNQNWVVYLTGKVIVSSPPRHDDSVVVAIYGMRKKLAYCRPNADKWTPIRTKFTAELAGGFYDILFHKGKLYGLNYVSGLAYFDDICANPKMTEVVVEGEHLGNPAYLVESSDGEELLMVYRDVDNFDDKNPVTLGFGVYRLDSSNSRWIEVKDIGDDMLFVGFNSSISRSSRDFPGCRGNSIYFTDSFYSQEGKELKQEDSDMGVFNIKDGSIERFKCNPRFIWPLPIWVTPPS